MTTIKPEALESCQEYRRESRKTQEVFSCQCGELLTELEHSKNALCFGCRQEEDS